VVCEHYIREARLPYSGKYIRVHTYANFEDMAVDSLVCAPILPVASEIAIRITEPRIIARIAGPSFVIDAAIPPSMNAGIQTLIPQITIPISNQLLVFSTGTGFVP